MDEVWLALVAVGAVFANWFVRRSEKRADWARQDKVAERVETAAARTHDVAVKAEEAAALLLESNTKIAQTAVESKESTDQKLGVIHTLVNSNMTAAMQAEFDATVLMLAQAQEVIALKRALGHEPTPGALAAVEETKKRIQQLKKELVARLGTAKITQSWDFEEPPTPSDRRTP